jgi:hypothetical protein
MKPSNPKISIDINIPASEEYCGGLQEGTRDVSSKKNIKNLEEVIKKLKLENQALAKQSMCTRHICRFVGSIEAQQTN